MSSLHVSLEEKRRKVRLPNRSNVAVVFHVKVRLSFPSLMGHAAMLQTMETTDRDSTSSFSIDPAARLMSLQKNPAETSPQTPLFHATIFL
jgi:hypothetical protein